eukprot:Sdes_comp18022_c0_seq1m7318
MDFLFVEKEIDFYIPILPHFLSNPKDGIKEYLKSLLMRYNDIVDGFIIAYNQLSLLSDCGKIISDCPAIFVSINCKLLCFCPKIGHRVCGIVNKISNEHIGVLILGRFNASIPSKELPEKFSCDPLQQIWFSTNEDELEGENIQICLQSEIEFLISKYA